MRILYFNNCWFTNVGEAFIDVGGMALIKKVWGNDAQIACLSAMTDYYCKNSPSSKIRWRKKKPINVEAFKINNYLNADYVILPGMCGTEEFLNAPSRIMVDELVSRGVKLVFWGLGCEKYSVEESDALKKYFDKVKPAFIMSRDNETYDAFKDVVPCVKGLDCALWSIDSFDPRGFAEKKYEVITFNRSEEPFELKKHMTDVVRPWHMQSKYRYEDYHKEGLISDTPYDYLTLYANAERVYTDLVHATIVSLMYGTPVKYWRTDKRCQAFYALNNLKEELGWLSVPEDSLKEQKKDIVMKMRNIITNS